MNPHHGINPNVQNTQPGFTQKHAYVQPACSQGLTTQPGYQQCNSSFI